MKDITYEFQIYELPAGFEQIEVKKSPGKMVVTYENYEKEMIKFTQLATESLTHLVDQEQGEVSTEKLAGRNIDFYEHVELITAVWTEDGYLFKLTYYGNVSKEEIKNIITSIK